VHGSEEKSGSYYLVVLGLHMQANSVDVFQLLGEEAGHRSMRL
jgi:hypothetical protein